MKNLCIKVRILSVWKKIFPFSPGRSDESPFQLLLCGITYPDPNYKIYRHCSDVYVIEYIEKGAGTVICNQQPYRLRQGDAYILPAGTAHRYYADPQDPWQKSG